MESVKVKKVYRHYKGNYYIVEDIAKDCDTLENVVIYRTLYDNSLSNLWTRNMNDFLSEVSIDNPKNVTGQKYKFELVENFNNKEINKW